MSFRIPGFGENRDGGAPGLMIYGLHNDLGSSDSSDSDYNPNSKVVSSESQSESEDSDSDSDDEVGDRGKKRKRQPSKRNVTKLGVKVEKNKKNGENVNERATRSSRRKGSIVTREVERQREVRERSLPTHPTPPSGGTWGSLPTEVLSHIFTHILTCDELGVQYLCRCASVCTNWYRVASQPVGWQGRVDLSFLGGKEIATNDLLIRLTTTRFGELKELNLRGWRQTTETGVASVAQHCVKLQEVDLSNCQKKLAKMSLDNFIALGENTDLRRVNFSNLRLPNTSKCFVSFLELRGVHLTHLYLSDNVSTGSVVMSSICDNCPNLQVLDLSNTSVRSICFPHFQKKCNKMRELYLANLSIEPKTNNNNHNTGEVNPGFTDLRMLSVAKYQILGWFTDNLIGQVLRDSCKLTMLDIRGNRSITHIGLEIPSDRVERLFMSHTNISQQIAELIPRKWGRCLWDLDLSWSDAYGIPFDYLIDLLVTGASRCSKLRQLNLSGTSCSDAGVQTVLTSCPLLQNLDLSSCRGISRGQKRFHEGAYAVNTLRRYYHVHMESNDEE